MGWVEQDLAKYEEEQATNENYWDSLVEDARSNLKYFYKLNEDELEDVLRDILDDADYDYEDLKWLKEKVMESQEWEDNQKKENEE